MSQQPDIVLVTGSSGLIGAPVCERLATNYTVVGFSHGTPDCPPAVAACLSIDLTDDASARRGMRAVRDRFGERIASVIHLAAYYDFSGEPSRLYEDLTVRGTERLLRELQAFQVEQFVFASTMLVHAPCEPGQRINEDSPLEPKWDYPRSKVQTEELIRARRGDIPAVLLRIAGVYDDYGHSVPLAHQIERIYERTLTSHVYPGDISRGQALVHLTDVVDAFELVVRRRKQLPPELPLLIGEDETLSYDELQRILGQLIHGEAWETQEIPKPLAKTGAWFQDAMPVGEEPFIKPWMVDLADDHFALDITRARTTLGWQPQQTLRHTLPKMIAALKADPHGWYEEHDLTKPGSLAKTTGA